MGVGIFLLFPNINLHSVNTCKAQCTCKAHVRLSYTIVTIGYMCSISPDKEVHCAMHSVHVRLSYTSVTIGYMCFSVLSHPINKSPDSPVTVPYG